MRNDRQATDDTLHVIRWQRGIHVVKTGLNFIIIVTALHKFAFILKNSKPNARVHSTEYTIRMPDIQTVS